jgi:glycine betaine/proline transport system substrate-binding protein
LSWRPHPMWVDYDLKILEDTKGIWETYGCQTGVNNNLKEDAPDLYKFIQEFSLPLDDIEKLLVKMEDENIDIEVLAKDWIEQNREEVDNMLGK